MGRVFVGHDWAEDHHDVLVEDDTGRRLAGGRLPDGAAGIAGFHAMLVEHADDPVDVVIATETDRGLFVNALVAAGYTVIAVNPLSTSRYRERHSTSGAKSDPGDAKVLADLARTDAHNHRQIAADSELGEAIKTLARAHQSMIWTRQRQANQLRSTLREFYPRPWSPSMSSPVGTRWRSCRLRRHRLQGRRCRCRRSNPPCDAAAGNAGSSNALSRSRPLCAQSNSRLLI